MQLAQNPVQWLCFGIDDVAAVSVRRGLIMS
jgi:hypothetical protein